MNACYVISYQGQKSGDTGTATLSQHDLHTLQFVARWEEVTLTEVIELQRTIIEDAALNGVYAVCEIQAGL